MDFFEACEKYSKFPRLIILKIELQRRGFILSQSALDNVNILIHQTKERSFSIIRFHLCFEMEHQL